MAGQSWRLQADRKAVATGSGGLALWGRSTTKATPAATTTTTAPRATTSRRRQGGRGRAGAAWDSMATIIPARWCRANQAPSRQRGSGPLRAFEHGGPHTPAGQFPEEGDRLVEQLGQPAGTRPGEAAVGRPDGGDGGDGAGGHGRPVDGTEHLGVEARAPFAPHLDPDGAEHPLRVRRAQHRQPGRHAVAAGGGQAGGDPLHAGEGRDEQQGVGHAAPVAIGAADRVGKPAQLATGAVPAGAASPPSRQSTASSERAAW